MYFDLYSIIVPHSNSGSVNVRSVTVKGVDDPQSALRSFLVDIRVSEDAECRGFLCYVVISSEAKIQRQLFPISLVQSMASTEPLIEENNEWVDGNALCYESYVTC